MDHSWILVIIFLCDNVVGEPCKSYRNISETTLQNSWANSKCFPSSPIPTWYRFTSNAAGTLSVNCPTGSACGGTGNVWIKDSLPVYSDGTTSVNMCISLGSNCCALENALRTRNCNSFFVFELRRLPNCGIHYCFNKTDVTLVTVPTTTTHSTTSTAQLTTSTTTTTRTTTQSTTSSTPTTQSSTSAMTTQPTATTQSTTSTTIPTTSTTQFITSKITTQSTTLAIESQWTTSNTTTSSTIIKSKTPTTTTHASTLLSTFLGSSSTPTISNKSKNDQGKKKPNESNLTTAVAVGASIGALILVVIIFFIVFRVNRPKDLYVIKDDLAQPIREEQTKNAKFNLEMLQFGNSETLQDTR